LEAFDFTNCVSLFLKKVRFSAIIFKIIIHSVKNFTII